MKAIYFPDIPTTNPLNGVFNTMYIPEILEEIYIKRVYQEIFEGKSGLTILDLGANVGLATQYFRQFGHVYSFEPDPTYFECLSKNVVVNDWDNVDIYPVAVSDKDGTAVYHPNESNKTAGSLDNPFYNALKTQNKYSEGTPVQTVSLKTFIEGKQLDRIDFVKMDIEGQESAILNSEEFKEMAPKIKALMVEFHNGDNETLVPYLEGLGFTSKRFVTDTCNYLFTRNA